MRDALIEIERMQKIPKYMVIANLVASEMPKGKPEVDKEMFFHTFYSYV